MYTRIMLFASLGAFTNAFLFAAVNPVHGILWALLGGLGLFSIRNRSSKAPETLDTLKRIK